MKSSLATAKTRLAEQTSTSVSDREPAPGAGAGAGGMPDLSALAGMFGGGGAGGAGGMPDIASMMRNPQMMAMYVTSPQTLGRCRWWHCAPPVLCCC